MFHRILSGFVCPTIKNVINCGSVRRSDLGLISNKKTVWLSFIEKSFCSSHFLTYRHCYTTSSVTLQQNQKISPEISPEISTSTEKPVINFEKLLRKIQKDSVRDVNSKKVFAVVHIAGKQFKVATNDIVMINMKIEAQCGDLIRLEKVLAVGSRSYTLLGQPLLKRDLVNIQALVMEKTKGEKKIAFKKKRRKGYKRWKGHRQDLSVLKIKSITYDTSVL